MALTKDPMVTINLDDAMQEITLSKVLHLIQQKSLRRPQQALILAIDIIKQCPNDLAIYHLLFSLLKQASADEQLARYAQQAVDRFPDDAISHFALATAFRYTRNPTQSLAALKTAISLAPNNLPWRLQMAIQVKELGNFEQAKALFNNELTSSDLAAEALYWRYNIEKKLSEDEQKLLLNIVDNPHQHPSSQIIYASFCLYQYFEDQQDHQHAWYYLSLANQKKQQQISQIAPASFKKEYWEHQQIPLQFADTLFSKVQTTAVKEHKKALFICGLPRSGTTLAEQILSSHSEVCAGDELFALAQASANVLKKNNITENFPAWSNTLNATQWKEIGSQYDQLTKNLREPDEGNYWLTDKMPLNYKAIGIIRLALPQAKIIYCKRNPIDLLFACYKQLLGDGNLYCYQLDNLCEMIIAHHKVMQHWLKLFPEQIFVLEYEQLLANQEAVTHELLDFIGLKWQAGCLNFHLNKRIVHTISNVQIRQPLFKSNHNAWQPYQEHLQPYIDKLANAGIID